MLDETTKERLLEQFRGYLDQYAAEKSQQLQESERSRTSPESGRTLASTENPAAPDLYSFFAELVALKHEVKLESRQVKNALEQFKAVFDNLQSQQADQRDALELAREQGRMLKRQAIRALALELVELRDRLAAGLDVMEGYRSSRLVAWRKRKSRWLAGLQDGQQISLRRLDQLLVSQRVQPLDVLGKLLDPMTMRCAEIDTRDDIANGIVTAELRRGYTFEGELLRNAEVKVNKYENKIQEETP